MKVRHIDKVIAEMGIGVTEPLNCNLDNGKSVIFKTYNNEQGNLILVNEIIAYRIAQNIGLTIPNSGFAEIDDNTQILINHRSIPKGVGFFSSRIEHATTAAISRTLLLKHCVNRDELVKFILFDHLIYNKDRNPGNMLYSMKDKKIYMIDHSHCFNLACIWDRVQLRLCMEREDFRDTVIMERNIAMYHKFIGTDNISYDILLKISEEFKEKLSEEYFNKAILDIPQSWNIAIEDLEVLSEYLTYRLRNLEYMCKMIIEYINRR